MYRSAPILLQQLLTDPAAGEEEYVRLRVTEFLLLLTKLSRIEQLSTKRVLELGCGTGIGLLLWSKVADEVTGVDLPQTADRAKRTVQRHGSPEIDVVVGRGEDDLQFEQPFDLVVTQYVLEHVNDMSLVISNTKKYLTPTGHVVHVLNNLVDRHDWHLAYRMQTSLLRRIVHSIRLRGLLETLRHPWHFTIPHEPAFGEFADELREYRLETWARRVIDQGFEIVDFFQTREVNWVLVTRPLRD